MRSHCVHSRHIISVCCLALAQANAVGARAETLTLADIQGAVIEATVVYQQESRREGWIRSFA